MVKLLKLISGEDVVAKVEDKGESYLLSNPLQTMLTPDGMAMMPLSPVMKGTDILVGKDKIVFMVDVRDELVNQYNARFGGIVKPQLQIVGK